MKNILILFSILYFAIMFSSCSDDTVSEQTKNPYISSAYVITPDSLYIFFDVRDTNVTFSRLDSNLQFSGIPKIFYNINPTDGYGDIILRRTDWTNIWSKHFTGYMNDSITLPEIPWMSYFTITNFVGTLSVKITRHN